MQVNHVDFLLTFKCPAKCRHCSYKAGPERSGYIKLKEASQYIEDLSQLSPLESIWVHGGEPFLYFNNLVQIIKEAKSWNIPRIGVITNSYWAKSEKKAYKMLSQLRVTGLTSITFSSDAFHQEFVPIKYVKNGLKSAVGLGFDKITVDSYFLDDVNIDNEFNQITRKNLEQLEQINQVKFQKLVMSVEGRGTNLKQYVKLQEELPSGKCPVPFWIEGDLEDPKTIEIDCEGNVTLCPGICIGNTTNWSLQEIIKECDVNKHPILSIILNHGPIGLLDEAKKHGFQQDQRFVNECHLCCEMRRYLQPIFSSFLAPKSCY